MKTNCFYLPKQELQLMLEEMQLLLVLWTITAVSSMKVISKTLRKNIMKVSLSRNPEISHLRQGTWKYVIGVDEAGRGPLAGPVVAAACYIPNNILIDGIVDSKATTEAEREKTYDDLVNNKNVVWGVSIVSHTEIDEINILEASLKAMRQATESLLSKIKSNQESFKTEDYLALIDGNKLPKGMTVEQKFVIKGDSIIYSIAAASIIAKVTRDRIMVDLAKTYPEYNLDKHKGYPTLEHRTTLLRLGPTPIHRMSYGPVKLAAEKHGISKKISVTAVNNASSTNFRKRKMDPSPNVDNTDNNDEKPLKKKVAKKSEKVNIKKSSPSESLSEHIDEKSTNKKTGKKSNTVKEVSSTDSDAKISLRRSERLKKSK